MPAKVQNAPQRSILKAENKGVGSGVGKKVFFDEILIREYPIILGDNPAVSSGAPITIGWNYSNSSIADLDFFEYCRAPQRRSRKKLILSVRRRAGFLLASGYSLQDIANATMEAEDTKKMRAESLRSAGWSNPWELLNGAVETTGTALRRADVLGVGAVVGVGVKGGKMLVDGAMTGTRAVTGVGNNLVVKPVGKVVTTTGKVVTSGMTQTGKVIGTGISSTGRAMGSVMNSTGRALSFIVNSGGTGEAQQKQSDASGQRSPKRELSPKRQNGGNVPDLTAINVQ